MNGLTPKKGSPIVYILLLALIISLMVVLKNCSHSNSPSDFLNQNTTDTLQVAIEYSPLSCYTYNDTLGGFCFDAFRMMMRQSGTTVKYNPIVTLYEALNGLESGKYDIVIAQFPVTKENRKLYLFTDNLYIDRQILVQRKDSTGSVKVRNQFDLAGKTLYVVKDSPMRERIANLSNEIGDTIYIAEDDIYGPEQLFLRVVTSDIDYAVINEATAKELALRYDIIDINTGISFSQFQSMVVRKDRQALCDSLNKCLKQLKQTQEFKVLQSRYNITE